MNKRGSIVVLLTVGAMLACNFPVLVNSSAAPTETPLPAEVDATPINIDEVATDTATVAPPTSTATATTAATATPCSPQLSANSPVNVRRGPGVVYDAIAALNTGQIAAIQGRNEEGTWWYIALPGESAGHGWVAASVTTVICDASRVAVIAAPPTPTEAAPEVVDVSVWVDPEVISVPGCMGPITQSTAGATIEVSGPMKFKWHFNTDQLGALPTQTLSFIKAGSKDVSETFMPPMVPGTYWVRLVIEGVDLSGFDIQAKYKINC